MLEAYIRFTKDNSAWLANPNSVVPEASIPDIFIRLSTGIVRQVLPVEWQAEESEFIGTQNTPVFWEEDKHLSLYQALNKALTA
jgi:hypothetical protein